MNNFDDLSPVQMLARTEALVPNLINDEIEHLDACAEVTDILEFTKLSVVASGDEDTVYSPSYSRGLAQILNHVQDKLQEGLTSTDSEWEAIDRPDDHDDQQAELDLDLEADPASSIDE